MSEAEAIGMAPPGDAAGGGETISPDTALARFILELRSKGLTDPTLLNAFERVPRAAFLPDAPAHLLYAPVALPLACGEEATDPITLARHLLLLDPKPGMRIIEIGTGSGFLAAILARLGAEVVTIERYRTLLKRAERVWRDLGAGMIRPVHGDGLKRLDVTAGFGRIIVNGAIEEVPGPLLESLAPGGVMLAHRQRGSETRLLVWRKDLAGHAEPVDCGASRMGRMRAGLPAAL